MKEKDKERLKKIAEKIAFLREKKGLSLRQLAAKCDVDYAKVSKIETKYANFNITTLLEIAEGLEVKPKDLLNIDFD